MSAANPIGNGSHPSSAVSRSSLSQNPRIDRLSALPPEVLSLIFCPDDPFEFNLLPFPIINKSLFIFQQRQLYSHIYIDLDDNATLITLQNSIQANPGLGQMIRKLQIYHDPCLPILIAPMVKVLGSVSRYLTRLRELLLCDCGSDSEPSASALADACFPPRQLRGGLHSAMLHQLRTLSLRMPTTTSFAEIFARCPNLTHLRITVVAKDPVTLALSGAASVPATLRYRLSSFYVGVDTSHGSCDLANVLPLIASIDSLSLSLSCDCAGSTAKILYAVANPTYTTSLRLWGYGEFPPAHRKSIPRDSISRFTNLRSLTTDDQPSLFGRTGFTSLFSAATSLEQLIIVYFSRLFAGDLISAIEAGSIPKSFTRLRLDHIPAAEGAFDFKSGWERPVWMVDCGSDDLEKLVRICGRKNIVLSGTALSAIGWQARCVAMLEQMKARPDYCGRCENLHQTARPSPRLCFRRR